MKKAKYFLGVFMFLILVLYGIRIMVSPHCAYDVFEEHLEDITPGKNSSDSGHFNVQEYDNTKYFIDDCNLYSLKDHEKKIVIKDVYNFLFLENEMVYTLFDDEKKIYSINFQDNSKRVVAHVSVDIFLNCKNFVYIYSQDNYLYKYDKDWNKIETISIKKKGYRGSFERASVKDDKIVFYTEDSDVYIYDVMTDELQEIIVPGKSETNYSKGTDIIQWDEEIYYMLCYYDDGDMHDSMTRIESAETGIYKLDIEDKKFLKVSNNDGDFLIVLNNKLCVAVDYFFGISYKVKKVDFVESNE